MQVCGFAEISRLQHSIGHLERSNRELDDFTKEEGLDDNDRKEFQDSIKENQETMYALLPTHGCTVADSMSIADVRRPPPTPTPAEQVRMNAFTCKQQRIPAESSPENLY